jgi:transmembrane sensor
MSDTFDWRIIDRQLAGEASSADLIALRRWLAENPRHAELLGALREAAQSNRDAATEHWNVEAAWLRVAPHRRGDRANALELRSVGRPERSAPARDRRWYAWGAVGLAAAAALAALLARPFNSDSLLRLPSAMQEIVAANGQQTQVTLHDGTRVVLNAGSKLRYAAADPGRGARDVELDGEAYFDVVHDDSRPFRVHARGSVAEDLGTRFVVRAYKDSRHVEVLVEQGRVSLRRERAVAPAGELGPGQLGRVEDDWSVTVTGDADVERWLSWTHGVLVLDGMTLAEAATEIGRRYDARIVVADPALARRRVSARFHDESLASVLDALTLAVGARWSRDGQRLVVTSARQ